MIDNATKDFLFIRTSGNPIDASGFIKMRTSGDLSHDGYSEVKKINKSKSDHKRIFVVKKDIKNKGTS